ncbi:MAG: hypothetical protein LBU32_19955 [Clostridiales bacterium]|jgi:hypothetical protein|nr:hypothetical protein [Clostridiales bacterium]
MPPLRWQVLSSGISKENIGKLLEGGALEPGSRRAELPRAPTINRILKSLDHGDIQRIVAGMSMSLPVKFKENRKSLFMGKYVFCMLDATVIMSSKVEYSSKCLTKAHRDDEGKATSVDFYNSALELKVHLGDGIVSSLLTEFIENGWDSDHDSDNFDMKTGDVDPKIGGVNPNNGNVDPKIENVDPNNSNVDPENGGVDPKSGGVDPNRSGVESGGTNEEQSKQKCELTAFYSLAPKIRDLLGGMPLIIAMDGLYECKEVLAIFEECGWEYIIRHKNGRIPALGRKFERMVEAGESRGVVEAAYEIVKMGKKDLDLSKYDKAEDCSPKKNKKSKESAGKKPKKPGKSTITVKLERACSAELREALQDESMDPDLKKALIENERCLWDDLQDCPEVKVKRSGMKYVEYVYTYVNDLIYCGHVLSMISCNMLCEDANIDNTYVFIT